MGSRYGGDSLLPARIKDESVVGDAIPHWGLQALDWYFDCVLRRESATKPRLPEYQEYEKTRLTPFLVM